MAGASTAIRWKGRFVALARQAGLDPAGAAAGHRRLDEIPFDAGAPLHGDAEHGGGRRQRPRQGRAATGARHVPRPDGKRRPGPIDRDDWMARIEDLAARGSAFSPSHAGVRRGRMTLAIGGAGGV